MPTEFVARLALLALLLLLCRFVVPGLPPKRLARRLSAVDLAAAAVGLLGLVLHCASMFFEPLVSQVPGTAGIISQINAMGLASMVWFVVPSVLLVVSLRRQTYPSLAVLTCAIAAVGVTMYNGAALWVHLTAIFAASVVISGILFILTLPPWRAESAQPAPVR